MPGADGTLLGFRTLTKALQFSEFAARLTATAIP